ncbi:hypothetical protein PanWU01x14_344700 [Parasponia andersonii]|uniref:Uncharacterized protein n=1 Tax=Parasponia andersonii TaxID=3476 RepID=A0A2P5ACY8_PARAD|nr:hypothetical protein PanWU01x14_344700 [Parasponia andersonii]
MIPIVQSLLRSASKKFFAQLIPPRTFSRAIGKYFIARCDSHSMIFIKVCWQAFFAQLIPLRTFFQAIGKHFIVRYDSHSTIFIKVYWQAFFCTTHCSSYVFSGHRTPPQFTSCILAGGPLIATYPKSRRSRSHRLPSRQSKNISSRRPSLL